MTNVAAVMGGTAAASASIAWTDLVTSLATTTTIDYGSRSLGTANANRIVAVAIFYRGTNSASVTGVTIGGVTASQVTGAKTTSTGVNAFTDIWYAAVPTGTSGNIVVTYDLAPVRTAVEVYSVITATATPSSGTNQTASANTTVNQSITVPNNGVGLAFVANNGSADTTTVTLTNAVEDAGAEYLALGTSSVGTSGTIAGTGASVSVTGTINGTANQMNLSLAAWSP